MKYKSKTRDRAAICRRIVMGPARIALLILPLLVCASAKAGSISTLFASNNGGANGGAVYFDAQVLNPAGLEITGLELNTDAAMGGLVRIDMYTTPGTRVGNETNMGVWKFVAVGFGFGAGNDVPTPIALTSFNLSPGSHGIVIVLSTDIGGVHRYTNGNGMNETYANADITLAFGAANNTPFSGGLNQPRVWNGTIQYNVIGDSDNDGFADGFDNCPAIENPGQANADGDAAGDLCDECPNDPAKTAPGACGCGVADTDANANGTADCNEPPPAGQSMNSGCASFGVFPLGMLLVPLVVIGRRIRRTEGLLNQASTPQDS